MIRAVLFDLGDTLVSGDKLLPGVRPALESIAALKADGAPLQLGLVSDWEEPDPSADPAALERSEAAYVELVERVGLLDLFSPPKAKITLSTSVGVRKPDPRIFERALVQLGLPSDQLDAAVFITENAAHVAAARALGMNALRFGEGGDFAKWNEAPALIGGLVEHGGTIQDPEARAAFTRGLKDNELVAPAGEPLAPGQTHEEDPEGGPPRRKRFSLK